MLVQVTLKDWAPVAYAAIEKCKAMLKAKYGSVLQGWLKCIDVEKATQVRPAWANYHPSNGAFTQSALYTVAELHRRLSKMHTTDPSSWVLPRR